MNGVRLYSASNQPQQIVQKCWAKTILLSRTGMLQPFSSNSNLQGHILSTMGVALSRVPHQAQIFWNLYVEMCKGLPK
jgi:hypothetical protein